MSVSADRQLVGGFAQLAQALGTAPDEAARLEIAVEARRSLVEPLPAMPASRSTRRAASSRG